MPDDHTSDICPFCQLPIELGQPTSVCPECGELHHAACWQENGGCASSDCSEEEGTWEPWYSLRSIGSWCIQIIVAAVIGISFAYIWSYYRPKPPASPPITPPEVVKTLNHPPKLISRKQWGRYQVVIDEPSGKWYQTLHIMKGKKVVDELREAIISTKVVSISGPSSRELEVCLYSGGSAQYVQYVYLSQKKGIRRILQLNFAGGVYGHRDMNHDGRQEILLDDRCLEGFGSCNAATPRRIVVIGWDHGRFIDKTAHYHKLTIPDMYDAKSRLIVELRSAHTPNRTQDEIRWGVIYRQETAMYYLLAAAVAGQADTAYRWIMNHAPLDTRQSIYEYKHAIIGAGDETDVDIRNLGNSPGSYPWGELINNNGSDEISAE